MSAWDREETTTSASSIFGVLLIVIELAIIYDIFRPYMKGF